MPARNVGIGSPEEPFMGAIVNLRSARKQAKRHRAGQEAAQNRLAHGRSKAEKALQRAQSEKTLEKLDQHRIESKP